MASNVDTSTVGGKKLSTRNLKTLKETAAEQYSKAVNSLRLLVLQAAGAGVPGELDVRTVGLRTFRRGGTTDAKDCSVHPTAVDVHCRWRNGGVSTQDIYDARSIKRRVRVSGAVLAEPSA